MPLIKKQPRPKKPLPRRRRKILNVLLIKLQSKLRLMLLPKR